jgi:trimethylamine:corrinoid methyltransferase-like protein
VRQLLLAGVAHSPTYLAAAIEQQRRAEVMAGASA